MKKLFIVLLVLTACSAPKIDLKKQAIDEITKTDLAMSDMATREGFFKALLHYVDDEVIFPREGKLPLMNKAEALAAWRDWPAIKEITWKPLRAEAAESGDLGYTFGFSTYNGADTTTYTSYCTIWRKQKDGT
jgi:ketosteroid isomerase-like protein